MKARRTVLDSELISMSGRLERGDPGIAVLPLETFSSYLRTGHMPEGDPPASTKVSVKLIVAPGAHGHVRRWAEKVGGNIVSDGPEVLLCELDVGVLKDLDNLSGVRRAEAARQFLPRLTDARGGATGLDLALESHDLTGRDVVVGVIDTGIDWRHSDFRDDQGGTRLDYKENSRKIKFSNGLKN